jgi:hypothetical protein
MQLTIDETMRGEAAEIAELLKSMNLRMSAVDADRVVSLFKADKLTIADVSRAVDKLSERISDELGLCHLLLLSADERELFGETEPYGTKVRKKFPGAREDLEEAAKCLAVDRGTACVMHLMRAMEMSLHQLAGAVGANFKASDQWDSILNELDKTINGWGYQTKAEVLRKDRFRQVHTNLASVKRAWRHPYMHARFSATPEVAKDIFNAVGGFMRQFAEVA